MYTQISKPKNPAAICHHNHIYLHDQLDASVFRSLLSLLLTYIVLRPIVHHGTHVAPVGGAEVHAASPAVQLAKLKACLSHSGGVDNRC